MRWERGRWLAAVRRSRAITDGTRVLLLTMLEHADAAGHVRVPRSRLAAELDRSPKLVTDRIAEARDAGWLSVVQRGRPPHGTATWALIFGRVVKAKSAEPLSGEDVRDRLRGDPVLTSTGVTPSSPLNVRSEVTPFLPLERGPRPHPCESARSPELQRSEVTPGLHPDTGPQENHTGRRQAPRSGPAPLLALVPSDSPNSSSNGRAVYAS